MKKAVKLLSTMLLLIGIIAACGTTTSCKSSTETMYSSKNKTSKTINRNYRVRGNNQRNSSTYRSY